MRDVERDAAWLTERPIAHRGLHSGPEAPENSLPAFDRAAAEGFPIELDVRLLADGEVAVFHDADLGRMTGVDGPIAAQMSGSLRDLQLLGTDHGIPLLEEVLDLAGSRVPILVEIKSADGVGPLESAVARLLDEAPCGCAVQSFNPFSLRWFRRNVPRISRGQLAGDFRGTNLPGYQRFLLSRYALNSLSRPDFLAHDIRCLPDRHATRERRRRNIPLLTWTVRTEKELAKASDAADNIIFEGIRP